MNIQDVPTAAGEWSRRERSPTDVLRLIVRHIEGGGVITGVSCLLIQWAYQALTEAGDDVGEGNPSEEARCCCERPLEKHAPAGIEAAKANIHARALLRTKTPLAKMEKL